MPINKVDGKKDGKQKYRVRVNYTDDYGKARQIERTAYGLEEAKAMEVELNYKINSKEEVIKSITMQQLHEEYIRNKKVDTRESTVNQSASIYDIHIKDFFNGIQLDKIKLPILQSWKNALGEKDLSLTTKKNIYSELRTMLNYAVKMEYIAKNPLDKIGNFKNVSEIKKEMQFYTPEEFLKFIKPAKELAETGTIQDSGFYIFFMLAYYTGCRRGEINALRWCDIKGEEVYITRSVSQKLKGEDRITPPKNKSSIRNIQLPTPLINALNSHKAKCKTLEGFSEECLVCGFDKPLRDTTLQKRYDLYAEKSGAKKIRIHDFRHSHASLLANNGINIQEIARRLGHAKIEMTLNTYAHLYPKEKERAIEVLNKIK